MVRVREYEVRIEELVDGEFRHPVARPETVLEVLGEVDEVEEPWYDEENGVFVFRLADAPGASMTDVVDPLGEYEEEGCSPFRVTMVSRYMP